MTPETSAPTTGLSWRTTIVAGSLALWLGGLAFYATVVIPAGSEVLGSHEAFGFITRQVAHGINYMGSGVVLVLLLNLLASSRRRLSRALWITLVVMVLCQATLFFLHPWLDALLDVGERRMIDADAFYLRHRVYLWTTMLQWIAGAVHFRRLVAQ